MAVPSSPPYSPFDDSPFSQYVPAVTQASTTDSLTITADSLSATEGTAWNGTVATFTDTKTSTPASSFTASINWGDGTSTTGMVSGSDGSFTVTGSHTYSSYGQFNVQVAISGAATAQTVSTASVSPPLSTINLSSDFGAVGITSAGLTVEGDINQYGESLSSQALGGSTLTWDGQTFDLGPVNQDDIVPAGGQRVSIPEGSYTALYLLGLTSGYNETASNVFTLDYTNSSSDQYTLGFSDWMNGYTGVAGTTAPGESIVAEPGSFDYWTGSADASATGRNYVYGYVIPVNPTRTLEYLVLPNSANMKILAIDAVDQPPQVDLSPYYDAIGITTPGSTVEGNADNYHQSLSSTALGGSTVTWNGQTFDLGPANQDDVVLSGGPPMSIPEGSYTALDMLALTMGYDESVGQVFTLYYTNGSSDQYTLGFSDWIGGYTGVGGLTAPGESIAKTMTNYDGFNGTDEVTEAGSPDVYVYGYVIPVNPTRTLYALGMPNQNQIKILAINTVDSPAEVNLGAVVDHTSSNNYQIPANVIGITENDYTTLGKMDSEDDSLSATQLDTASNWTSG